MFTGKWSPASSHDQKHRKERESTFDLSPICVNSIRRFLKSPEMNVSISLVICEGLLIRLDPCSVFHEIIQPVSDLRGISQPTSKCTVHYTLVLRTVLKF